jgi:long-chain fatty acid transport protein
MQSTAVPGFSRACLVAALLIMAMAVPAAATEGYFRNAYGARHGGLAGAGVADSRDATAAALNPAGLVHVKQQELDIAASVFSPRRKFDHINGGGFTPAADVNSDNNYFLIPNIAYSKHVGGPLFDTIAFTMNGNGGMNTTYKYGTCGFGAPGIFCGGRTGVNLIQMLMSIAVAKQIAPGISVGVAPILLAQRFRADGLGGFAGLSTDPAHLTNLRNDWAFGGGLRAGIEWAVMNNVRLGVAGTTPLWSQPFDGYRGLFAGQGGFDVPASVQAGIAVDLSKDVTVMADYRRIFYSSVESINNPSTNLFQCIGGNASFCLGGSNGAGFGWHDINVFKIGIEVRNAFKGVDLRAGYSYNDQPYGSRDVMINILAPGVVQHHFTVGARIENVLPKLDLELAAAFVPSASVKGVELNPPLAFGAGHAIGNEMWQFELTAGFKYKLGAAN